MQTIEKMSKKLRKYKKLCQSFKKYAKGQEIFGVWQGGSFLAYFVGDVAGRVGLGSYFLMCLLLWLVVGVARAWPGHGQGMAGGVAQGVVIQAKGVQLFAASFLVSLFGASFWCVFLARLLGASFGPAFWHVFWACFFSCLFGLQNKSLLPFFFGGGIVKVFPSTACCFQKGVGINRAP